MSKKLLSLVPLLAIAAFAVMPTASQALIPHWYKSGARQKGGTPVNVITWGGPVNLAQESGAGEINCKAVGAGIIENPKGATKKEEEEGKSPAGVGESLSSNFYKCVEPKCETEVAAAPEGSHLFESLGYKGKGFAVAENLPWPNQLIGAGVNTPPEYEEKLGVPGDLGTGQSWGLEIAPAGNSEAYSEGYPARYQAPGPAGGNPKGRNWGAPGAIGAIVGCEIFPNPEGNETLDNILFAPHVGVVPNEPERVAANTGEAPFEGELHPLIGGKWGGKLTTPSSPGETSFEGASSGSLIAPVVGAGNEKGQIKYEGYNAQEPLGVEN